MYPQWANIPLQGLDRCALTVDTISGPRCQTGRIRSHPLVSFHPLWIYMVSKKHSGKADQLTLASGGSEHGLV